MAGPAGSELGKVIGTSVLIWLRQSGKFAIFTNLAELTDPSTS